MKASFITPVMIVGIMCFSFEQACSQGMGIGIATPISVLHVYENTTNVSTAAGLTIEQNSTGDAVVQYLLTGGQRWVTGIDNSDGDKFKISSTVDVGSAPRITIQTTGEVGIGTATPDSKPLTIQGTGASNELISFKNSGGTTKWHINQAGSNDLNFVETSVADYRLYLKAGGNVGLGTNSPASLLNLHGSAPTLTLTHSSGTNQDNTGVLFFSEDATAGFKIRYDGSDNNLHFAGRNASTDSDWLTIQRADGAVGIGNTSPATNAKLAIKDGHVQVTQTTAPTIAVSANAGTGATATLGAGSTDVSGTITLTTGSGAYSNGTNLTVTFNRAYATAPFVILTPANDMSASSTKGWYPGSTTTTFTVKNDIAASASYVYKFNYLIIEP